MLLDGPTFRGQLPCVLCRHSRRRKTREEWSTLCGNCRSLTVYELDELVDAQDVDPDRVVVAPNLFRASRINSDARYEAALDAVRAHRVPAGGRILDVGCGVSAQADLFKGYTYVGADLNESRLHFAASQHREAVYAIQNITQMGFATASFDVVICLEVIEHLPTAARDALMRELFRVLGSHGLLVLSTPDGRRSLGKRIFGLRCERSHEMEMTIGEVRELVASAGGNVVGVAEIDNLIQPAGHLAAILTHLAGDRAGARRAIRRFWSRLGYRTLLYTITAAEREPFRDASILTARQSAPASRS